MNKPIYLSMSVLDLSISERVKLCHTETDSFVIYVKTEYFYEDIADDVKKWFDTSNYHEDDRILLPIGQNKKAIALFKDELEGKIMKEFVALRAKIHSYLMDGNSEHEKSQRNKIIKREFMFTDYKDCQYNDEIILKLQQRFTSDHFNV